VGVNYFLQQKYSLPKLTVENRVYTEYINVESDVINLIWNHYTFPTFNSPTVNLSNNTFVDRTFPQNI